MADEKDHKDQNADVIDLADKIHAARMRSDPEYKKQNTPNQGYQEDREAMGRGMRTGLEFVISIAAGVFIGLWLDKTFDTKPFFFIALFFLGVITGFVNVWRISNGMGYAVGYKQRPDKTEDSPSEDAEHKKD